MDFVTSGHSWTHSGFFTLFTLNTAMFFSFHFPRLLCPQKNEMSNELVVEGENSAPMSEVCSRNQMDAIEELQEEDEEEQE